MATDTAGPSPQDLAALESAFAADPGGTAYRSLAEAYLALERFMEAMVVCKKGVKANPEDPSARVLLAKVYAAQGKDRKAKTELQGALEVDAAAAEANRMLGLILLEEGEMESGTDHLKKAIDANPTDEETLAALEKWGIDYRPAEPETPPEVPQVPPPPADMTAPEAAASAAPPPPPSIGGLGEVQAPVIAPTGSAAPSGPPVMAAGQPVPVAAPAGMAPRPAPAGAAPRPAVGLPSPAPAGAAPRPATGIPRPAPADAAPRPAPVHRAPDADVDYSQYDETPPKKSSKAGLIGTIAVMVLGVVGLAGYGYWYTKSAEEAREMSKLLKTAQEQLSQDSYASYRAASGTLEKILDVDPTQFAAHSYLAYINILRWGLHGEGETYKQQGMEHISQAEADGREHSHLIAAKAYQKFFSGDHAGGIGILEEILGRQDVTSGLLSGALGTLYLWDGNLEKSQEWLTKANRFSPGDPFILSTLGELERRKGSLGRAWKYYDQALRFDTEHVESLLGEALIILDDERMSSEKADPLIKKVEAMDPETVSPRQKAFTSFARAQLLYEQGKTTEAKEQEDDALILQSGNPDIRLMIGRRLFREKNYDAAETAIRKAIELEPKRARFYVELAEVLLKKRGGAKEAVEALETARAALPDNVKLLVLLGDAHAASRDKGKALAAYAQAIEMEGGTYPEAQLAIGKLHRAERDYDKAIPELEKALAQFQKLIRPRGQAETSLELARIYLAQRDGEKAKEWLSKALKNDPTFADTYYFFGRSLVGTRATQAAGKEALNNYLQRSPSGEFAEAAKKLLSRL